jgi:hypothetical protein
MPLETCAPRIFFIFLLIDKKIKARKKIKFTKQKLRYFFRRVHTMTWGEYMIGLGAVAGIATGAGVFTVAAKKDALNYGTAVGVVIIGFIVFGGIASLSQLDSKYVAHCEASAAALNLTRSIETASRQAYIDHLKSTGLYDFWEFIKNGKVPEEFVKQA